MPSRDTVQGPACLRLFGVTLGYDGRNVLEGLHMEARPGEVVGLVGPNGCGKSTLIRGISRVVDLKAGRIMVDGRDMSSVKREELARLVAVVPQSSYMPPAFTVFEVALMGRTPHLRPFRGESRRDIDITIKAMEATGCAALADRRIGELSGGERQRVMVARALAQEPQVLLLDEPTAHLDLAYQLQVMGMVRQLCHARDLVVVMALHDLNLAAQYCDRLVILHQGRVYMQGTPDTLITPETIEKVYGVEAVVTEHPVNGLPNVMLIARDSRTKPGEGQR